MQKTNKLDVTVNESGTISPYANEDPSTGGGGPGGCCCVGCATCTNWGNDDDGN